MDAAVFYFALLGACALCTGSDSLHVREKPLRSRHALRERHDVDGSSSGVCELEINCKGHDDVNLSIPVKLPIRGPRGSQGPTGERGERGHDGLPGLSGVPGNDTMTSPTL